MLEPGESVAGIHNDRWLIRQVTSGNQVPDPGAKFLVGHRLDPPSSRSITTASRFLPSRVARALICSARAWRSSKVRTSLTWPGGAPGFARRATATLAACSGSRLPRCFGHAVSGGRGWSSARFDRGVRRRLPCRPAMAEHRISAPDSAHRRHPGLHEECGCREVRLRYSPHNWFHSTPARADGSMRDIGQTPRADPGALWKELQIWAAAISRAS